MLLKNEADFLNAPFIRVGFHPGFFPDHLHSPLIRLNQSVNQLQNGTFPTPAGAADSAQVADSLHKTATRLHQGDLSGSRTN